MKTRLLGIIGVAAMLTTFIGVTGASSLSAGAAVVVPDCVITFTPNPVSVGEDLTVSITGLATGETFDVDYTKDGSPVGSGTAVADSGGNYTHTVALTSDVAGSVLGYSIVGETSGATCEGTLSVNALTTTTEAPSTSVDPSTTAPATGAAAVNATPAFTG